MIAYEAEQARLRDLAIERQRVREEEEARRIEREGGGEGDTTG